MGAQGSNAEDAPFSPSEEWIDAFKRECTHNLRLDLKQYAQRRARGVRRVGGQADEQYAEDVVSNAIVDTLGGVVAWDPDAKPLAKHLEDTIKYRTRHDRERAKRVRHERLDSPKSTGESKFTRALVEVSLRQDQTNDSPEGAIFASEVIEQLRALAADDLDVLGYLDAVVAGATERTEIMEHAQLSMKAFRNTRLRLDRLVEQLDVHRSPVAFGANARGARA